MSVCAPWPRTVVQTAYDLDLKWLKDVIYLFMTNRYDWHILRMYVFEHVRGVAMAAGPDVTKRCLTKDFIWHYVWLSCHTWWRRPIGCRKSQVIFHKRATNYSSPLRKMTHKDTAFYRSSPPCMTPFFVTWHSVWLTCDITSFVSVLQCVAVCCSVLQCVAVWYHIFCVWVISLVTQEYFIWHYAWLTCHMASAIVISHFVWLYHISCDCITFRMIVCTTDADFMYGWATISRLLHVVGLFCKRALHKRLHSRDL